MQSLGNFFSVFALNLCSEAGHYMQEFSGNYLCYNFKTRKGPETHGYPKDPAVLKILRRSDLLWPY